MKCIGYNEDMESVHLIIKSCYYGHIRDSDVLIILPFLTWFAQGILLLYHYLLLYHPSTLPSPNEFLFNVQNIKYTQDLLHCTVYKITFPTSLYLPKSDSGQESYICFTTAMKSVLKFQNAHRSMFSL
jgi:hypothetical protein